MKIQRNSVHYDRCENIHPHIESESLDLICSDFPFGKTANWWDVKLKLDVIWNQYERIIKPDGVIVLFADQPFTSELVMSNRKMFRRSLVWKKNNPKGFLNANKMELRLHEDVLVFYKKLGTYNPQKSTGHKPVNSYTKHTSDGTNYGETKLGMSGGGSTERYPTSILEFGQDTQKGAEHPTQKPVGLYEYFIKTYTEEGGLVLDSTAGRGTLVEACINTGRDYIIIEMDREFNEPNINKRIAMAVR